jgi:hypothetical protein
MSYTFSISGTVTVGSNEPLGVEWKGLVSATHINIAINSIVELARSGIHSGEVLVETHVRSGYSRDYWLELKGIEGKGFVVYVGLGDRSEADDSEGLRLDGVQDVMESIKDGLEEAVKQAGILPPGYTR